MPKLLPFTVTLSPSKSPSTVRALLPLMTVVASGVKKMPCMSKLFPLSVNWLVPVW
jgi:hypothetical protein